ncbi:MAG TPA: hypothetical protein VFY40_24575 [Blastocatellia bacterium]|nr:hypothetical protein [Blastocatellia bacterium]
MIVILRKHNLFPQKKFGVPRYRQKAELQTRFVANHAMSETARAYLNRNQTFLKNYQFDISASCKTLNYVPRPDLQVAPTGLPAASLIQQTFSARGRFLWKGV